MASNNKTNIYDLVNEVNKNKKKSAMAAEKEINDIYSMLDDIKNDNNISVEDVREKVNSYASTSHNNINDNLANYSNVVTKPQVPQTVTGYSDFSSCLLKYIQGVDYGTNNSKEYVSGHSRALEKYFSDIKSNHKDLYVVESHLNNDIENFSVKSSLADKGYYDGLLYVLKSFRQAKATMTDEINNRLIEKLN